MSATILSELRTALTSLADEQTRLSGERFFREPVKLYGIKASTVTETGKSFLKALKPLPKNEVFALCEALWKSEMMEESFIACQWAYSRKKQFESADFGVFEGWVHCYLNNWASCDSLCNHTIGTVVEMYPQFLASLKQWTACENRWVKRAAAVTLIVPARRGLFLPDIFEIATLLLHDRDDMVQKGYGWMLKVASQSHLPEVFDFVMRNKATMPRTALRYAIEKMPEEMRKQAMEK
ncbi:MAG TPA: DNA alkylation repair protein [Bacteroidales bacterium]|nr:DNA alkylation repair protein [Bacteroidales bacterium]HRZ48819.1 DNA alkylation repair protein [Bacteroidales bacterium]